jgi:hypothetical protein
MNIDCILNIYSVITDEMVLINLQSLNIDYPNLLISIVLVEILPLYLFELTLEVLLELQMKVLPILHVFLVRNHHLQVRIDVLIVFYRIHQSNYVFLVVGKL